MTHLPSSPETETVCNDPADLWELYCAETPRSHRSPQGAMAFAFDKLTSRVAPTQQEPVAWRYDWRMKMFAYDDDSGWTTTLGFKEPKGDHRNEYRNVVPLAELSHSSTDRTLPSAESTFMDKLDQLARTIAPYGYVGGNAAIAQFLVKAREHLAESPVSSPVRTSEGK